MAMANTGVNAAMVVGSPALALMAVGTGAPEAAAVYDAIQDYAALNPTETLDFIKGVASPRSYPPTGAGTLGAITGTIVGAVFK